VLLYIIYATINFTNEFRNVSLVCVTEVWAPYKAADWAWPLHGIFRAGHGWLGVVGVVHTRFGVSQPAADAQR